MACLPQGNKFLEVIARQAKWFLIFSVKSGGSEERSPSCTASWSWAHSRAQSRLCDVNTCIYCVTHWGLLISSSGFLCPLMCLPQMPLPWTFLLTLGMQQAEWHSHSVCFLFVSRRSVWYRQEGRVQKKIGWGELSNSLTCSTYN